MSEDLAFLFGVHNHQPSGNFDSVIRNAIDRAYHPFLEAVREVAGLPVTVHWSGALLAYLRDQARPTFDLLGSLVSAGRVELLTGGFYEPILAMLPDRDKVGQIQALTEFIKASFGVSPRGMWLAERVWEPQLPRALREAGVDFVLLDDSHFAAAGLDLETLGGYYLTEEQGTTLAVFPISQRLRYLVPFAAPSETVQYLTARRDAGAVTLVDDGEKFGVWPSTHKLVYGEGWLRRFLEALGAAPGISMSTFSRYLVTHPPHGRIYLPTTSYTEMGEWALPADAAAELDAAKERLASLPEGARLVRLLRGGFWRNFLVKYPEVGDSYWKMLGLSQRVADELAASPGDSRLVSARERLWRGQANDAYWHGVFGGCYLPHLRRAVKASLVACDRLLGLAGDGPSVEWREADTNGDGYVEVAARTRTLAVTVNPERGGTLTELAYLARDVDVADVLTRRRESYHARVRDPEPGHGADSAKTIHGAATAREAGLASLLEYDRFRRALLLDGLFAEGGEVDPLEPWKAARAVVGERPMTRAVRARDDEIQVECALDRLDEVPLAVRKTVVVPATRASIEARYALRWDGTSPLAARWGVQLNVALSAGDALGRYFRVPGNPSLGQRDRLANRQDLALVDEWLGCALELGWTRAADAAWAPVETISLSEAGFERIYQGTAVLVTWPLQLPPGAAWETRITLTFADLAGAPR